MSEEASQISQFSLFQPVNHFVLRAKQLGVKFNVSRVKNAEASSNVSVVSEIGPILHTAFQDHVAQFNFLPRTNLQLKQLVTALFKVNTRHDYEINRFA